MRPPKPRAAQGALLTGRSLLTALRTREEIFRDGSWDERQVDGGGYNLRVADRWLVVPRQQQGDGYRVIAGDDPGLKEFVLGAGQSAVVATEERWSMDFNVIAALGPKFRWSARGLLLLHGMVAHPGYGRRHTSRGWELEEDLRLYLIIVNLGPELLALRHRDTIAYAQFYRMERPAEPTVVNTEGFDRIRERFFSSPGYNPAGGIGYLSVVRQLREDIAQTNEELEALRTQAEARASRIETSVDRVNNATNSVVVFGVFLVTATLLGVVTVTLTGIVSGLPSSPDYWQWAVIGTITIAYVAAVTVTAVAFIRKISIGRGRRE